MQTENLSTLKIYKLTKEQYDARVASGDIEEYAMYLTPKEEIDLAPYATKEELNAKADAAHNHDGRYYTETEVDEKIAVLNNSIDSKANSSHTHDDIYYTETEIDEKIDEISSTVADLSNTASSNYNESIIGLSVDGTTVTYIKGDGSTHTFETQDTDTTYSLGTDEVTGLTKLYATTGNAEDGTMTQKAIRTELDKKVGVAIDNAQDMLVFTV